MTRNHMNPARVASDLAEIAELDRRAAFAALLPVPEVAAWSPDMLDEDARDRHFAELRLINNHDYTTETLPDLSEEAITAEVIRFGAAEAEARFRSMGFVIV